MYRLASSVLLRRNLKAIPHEVGQVREPGPVLVVALLVKPRTLVEHDGVARVGKPGEHSGDVDRAHGRTRASQHGERAAKRRRHFGLHLGHRVRRAERDVFRPAGGVPHRLPERQHVGRSVREESERIEASRQWKHAVHGKKPVARLESGHPAVRCGPQHRAARLGANRKRHHAGRDRRGRPAGAPAGRVRQVARVARRARSAVRERRARVFPSSTAPRRRRSRTIAASAVPIRPL